MSDLCFFLLAIIKMTSVVVIVLVFNVYGDLILCHLKIGKVSEIWYSHDKGLMCDDLLYRILQLLKFRSLKSQSERGRLL